MSTSCAACGAPVPDGASNCSKCGTAQGMSRCPICGNVGAIGADSELRYACGLCGAPRFKGPVADGSRALPLLRKANDARTGRAKARIAAGFAGVGAAGTGAFTLLLLLIFGLKLWVLVGGVLFVGPLVLLLAWAIGQMNAKGKAIAPAVEAAYLAAATELAQKQGRVTPADLQQAFGLDAEQAEQLAAMVQVEAGLGGVRIAAEPQAKGLEAEFAELEAAAEAEASREAAAAKRP